MVVSVLGSSVLFVKMYLKRRVSGVLCNRKLDEFLFRALGRQAVNLILLYIYACRSLTIMPQILQTDTLWSFYNMLVTDVCQNALLVIFKLLSGL